jgi:hypothetical protein
VRRRRNESIIIRIEIRIQFCKPSSALPPRRPAAARSTKPQHRRHHTKPPSPPRRSARHEDSMLVALACVDSCALYFWGNGRHQASQCPSMSDEITNRRPPRPNNNHTPWSPGRGHEASDQLLSTVSPAPPRPSLLGPRPHAQASAHPPPPNTMNGKDAAAGSGSEHQYTPKNILVTGGAGFMYVGVGVRARNSWLHDSKLMDAPSLLPPSLPPAFPPSQRLARGHLARAQVSQVQDRGARQAGL